MGILFSRHCALYTCSLYTCMSKVRTFLVRLYWAFNIVPSKFSGTFSVGQMSEKHDTFFVYQISSIIYLTQT